MKNYVGSLLVSTALVCSYSSTANAQDTADGDYSLSVLLNSDTFFGFNPAFYGSYNIAEGSDFTFYGIQWSGGTGMNWGNWTEFGVGWAWTVGDWKINPQLGVLNGNLLSANDTPEGLEGIVPNLTVIGDGSNWMFEFYSGYYYGFEGNLDTSRNYIHTWVTPGYKFNNFFALGLHAEHLRFIAGATPDGQAEPEDVDLYLSVGPYIQFSDPKGKSFVRFIYGEDVRGDTPEEMAASNLSEFYKLTVGFNI